LVGKEIKSVVNITCRDVNEFLSLAAEMELKPEVQVFTLKQASEALLKLKTGKFSGAKILKID